MQLLLRDVFRDAVAKARKNGMWEKLTKEQTEALMSRYLLQQYRSGQEGERQSGSIPR